jgi:hypothetical protein
MCPIFREQAFSFGSTPEYGTYRLYRNVAKKLPLLCVTTQKSAVLIYFAAEA